MVKIEIGNWLKADYVRNGHRSGKIKDSGRWIPKEEAKFGKDTHKLTIVFPDGTEKDWTLNFTSLKNLVSNYGDDTDRWAGKIVNFELVKANVNGVIKDSIVGSGIVDVVYTD